MRTVFLFDRWDWRVGLHWTHLPSDVVSVPLSRRDLCQRQHASASACDVDLTFLYLLLFVQCCLCIAVCDRYHIRSPSSWIGKALCVRPAWDADTDTCQDFQPQCNCLPYLKKGGRGHVWLVADGYRYNMKQVPSPKPATYTDSFNNHWYKI